MSSTTSTTASHSHNEYCRDYSQFFEAQNQPILDIIKKGNLDELKILVASTQSPPYEKLINIAIHFGQLEILEFLLEQEKQAETSREYQNDLLIRFADNGVEDILEILLRHAEDLQVAYALEAAVASGSRYLLKALLDGGANVNAGDGLALLKAVTSNQNSALRDLIEAKADVNTFLGQLALSNAIKMGYTVMVRTLLDAGADLSKPGSTVLLDAFAPPPPPDCHRPINIDILYAILEKKPNLEIKNEFGNTPLHLAAREALERGNTEPFLMLWRAGANLHTKNHRNETPLDILEESALETYLELKNEGVPLQKIKNPSSSLDASKKNYKRNNIVPRINQKIYPKDGPTRDELLCAARENDLEKIEYWIKNKQLNSEYDLGLAIIEAIKEENFEIFTALLMQSQQPLWVEHRREAIRMAAEKNLRDCITQLLPTDPQEAAEFRGAALLAAAKAGCRGLALDMLDGSSHRALALALKNAAAEGDLELLQTLSEPISKLLRKTDLPLQKSEEKKFLLETLGLALQAAAENIHLETLEFLQKTLSFACKELAENGHPEGIKFLQETLGSCLKKAAENGFLEVIAFLLQIEEGNAITNSDKKIAIIRAKLHGFQDIIEAIENSQHFSTSNIVI